VKVDPYTDLLVRLKLLDKAVQLFKQTSSQAKYLKMESAPKWSSSIGERQAWPAVRKFRTVCQTFDKLQKQVIDLSREVMNKSEHSIGNQERSWNI